LAHNSSFRLEERGFAGHVAITVKSNLARPVDHAQSLGKEHSIRDSTPGSMLHVPNHAGIFGSKYSQYIET
jgi:hypothetical protein